MARREKKEPLVKYLHLTGEEVSLRLALEGASYSAENIDLDRLYVPLSSVKKFRDRYFLYYVISFFVLFMLHLRAVEHAEFMGVQVKQNAAEACGLMATSCIAFLYSYYQMKIARYEHLYAAIFKRAPYPKKQYLILRYPDAYNAAYYTYHLVGQPAYLMPKRSLPIPLVLLVVLFTGSAIVAACFWLWLIYSVSIELWHSRDLNVFWMRALIISSWMIILQTMLSTSTGASRRTYTHTGLVNLISRLSARNPKRHQEMIDKIADVVRRMRS